MRATLTTRLIEREPAPASGQTVIRDTECPGLYLLVGKATRSYMLKVDAYAQEPGPDGRRAFLGTRKVKIGPSSGPGALLPDDARRLARAEKAATRPGGPPARRPGPDNATGCPQPLPR
jgi:hypothetical protein